MNLRHRAHGGAGIFGGGLLVDGDGGGKAVDVVHVRLVHLPQKLPGIGGQGFHISPLSLGVDGVKGQRGFSRTGKPGEDHQTVPGQCPRSTFFRLCSRAPLMMIIFAMTIESFRCLLSASCAFQRCGIVRRRPCGFSPFRAKISSRSLAAFSKSRLPAAASICSSSRSMAICRSVSSICRRARCSGSPGDLHQFPHGGAHRLGRDAVFLDCIAAESPGGGWSPRWLCAWNR